MSVRRVVMSAAVICLFVIATDSFAQAPATLVYQGRLTNQSGAPLSGQHTVTFRFYAAPTGGTSLWTETLQITADQNGLFTAELGNIDPIDATVLDGSKRYLGLSVDAGLEMTPRQVVSSTAYALSARSAPVADGSITGPKLADGSVGSAKIADGTVASADLADGSVITSKLGPNAVNTDKILDAAVTSADIADGAVGAGDIALGAVNGSHVANKSLDGDDIADDITLGDPTTGSGYLSLKSSVTDLYAILMGPGDGSGGVIYTYDGNGNLINGMNADNGNVFASFFSAYDAEDNLTAGINGETGEVFGNLKSFVVADPSQSGRMIQYSSIEGPEAAIYCRGQADLIAGRAQIEFPEHFAAMAAPGTLTVSLTPRALDSKGVAAIDVSPTGMQIGELQQGTGSYSVDYVVYAVRKGFEDYQVYRNRTALTGRAQQPSISRPGGEE